MKLEEFMFDLPEDRIARFPAQERHLSRLMVVDRKSGTISHHQFKDLIDLLKPEDFFVVNNSKVIPARLFGTIDNAKVELLLVRFNSEKKEADAYTLPAKKFKLGSRVFFKDDLWADIIATGHRGKRTLCFNKELNEVFATGYAPLPPYIKRKNTEAIQYKDFDLERYQSVYARHSGSIAAPTAGLHFSPEMLDKIRKNHEILEITLNVGEATFQKIEVDDLSLHKMGREQITITSDTRKHLHSLKQTKKLIAVGTTSVRSLETYALLNPAEETFFSEIFISPGFQFQLVDKLITNFHLPGSSLFILTAAFGGLDLMKEAYRIAIENKYRFFSYGDAMFIL